MLLIVALRTSTAGCGGRKANAEIRASRLFKAEDEPVVVSSCCSVLVSLFGGAEIGLFGLPLLVLPKEDGTTASGRNCCCCLVGTASSPVEQTRGGGRR